MVTIRRTDRRVTAATEDDSTIEAYHLFADSTLMRGHDLPHPHMRLAEVVDMPCIVHYHRDRAEEITFYPNYRLASLALDDYYARLVNKTTEEAQRALLRQALDDGIAVLTKLRDSTLRLQEKGVLD